MIMKKSKEEKKMVEKIEYTKQGDYYMPNLVMEKEKKPARKYALMRYNYIKKNKNHELTILVMNKKLAQHLTQVQEQVSQRVEELVEMMKKQQGITEELKAKDQMTWVGFMNNIKATAEEIAANEIIYI